MKSDDEWIYRAMTENEGRPRDGSTAVTLGIRPNYDIEVDEIIPQTNGSYLVDAGISVRDLNERLRLNVPENGYYVTLAGFIMMKTGRLPTEGDAIDFEGNAYRIEQVVGRRIMRVRMTPNEPLEVEETEKVRISDDFT